MLFINTRPVERAETLSRHLQQAGIEVRALPLLSLNPVGFSDTLLMQFHQLESVQAIVVVSPTAVELGMDYLAQSGISIATLKDKAWIAVGQRTATVLAKYGIQAVVSEIESSEGMLSLDIFKDEDDLHRIAFWRGLGGRQFMMQQCRQRHIEVLNIVLYQRALPPSTSQDFIEFAQEIQRSSQAFWACISSEASWRYWVALCQPYAELLPFGHYLVLGPRLFDIVQQHRNQFELDFQITQISHLDADTILWTIHENIEITQRPL